MPTNLGPAEILVILVVALIVLGPKRLPEAGKQVGKALAEVRRWSRGIQTEIRDAFDVAEEPPMVSTEQVTAPAAEPEPTKPETTKPETGENKPESGETAPEPALREPATPSDADVTDRGPERPDRAGNTGPTNGSHPPDQPPSP